MQLRMAMLTTLVNYMNEAYSFLLFICIASLSQQVACLEFCAISHKIEHLCPSGIHLSVSHCQGLQHVTFHANINRPMKEFGPSDLNEEISKVRENGIWSIKLQNVHLQDGDVVNYWLQIIKRSQILNMKNYSWIYTDKNDCISLRSKHADLSDKGEECFPSKTIVSGRKLVCKGDLIFEDTFNFFDLSIWKHEVSAVGGGSNEFQAYVSNRNISRTTKGILEITPILTEDILGATTLYHGELDLRGNGNIASGESCTNPSMPESCKFKAIGAQILRPVLSAKLSTKDSFSFLFGRLVIRAKLPEGEWLWPGVYLLPLHNMYGPMSGEIALAERCRGIIGCAFRFDSLGSQMFTNFTQDNSDRFREYELQWTPDLLEFIVDGKSLIKISPKDEHNLYTTLNVTDYSGFYKDGDKMAPFDQPFYLSVSLAVGGKSDCFPDEDEADGTFGNNTESIHKKPWNNKDPSAILDFWEAKDSWYPTWTGGRSTLQIDYIKIWAL